MKTHVADGDLSAASWWPKSRHAVLAALTILTLGGFALRLAGIDQSLWGDEIWTHDVVTQHTFWGVFGNVANRGELNPPLSFLLAWLAGQVGDPTITIRVPSLVLGAATVPLVYVLGVWTVGRGAALVGAAFMAISPFAVYYSVESRAYAALMFFSALSTLMLLRALRRGGFLSWFAFGVSTAAVLYTHYTGAFVVLAQLGWALWTHRDRARQLVLVHVGVALAFVPWLPSFFEQRDFVSNQTSRLTERFPLNVDTFVGMVTGIVPNTQEPFGGSTDAIVWGTIGAALLAALLALRSRRLGRAAAAPRTAVLIFVLALVTPVGLVLYCLQPDTSLLLSRNLSASLPAFALAVGWLLIRLRPPLALAAGGLVFIPLVVGGVQTLDHEQQKPPYRQVAHYLDGVAGRSDAVVAGETWALDLYFKRSHRVFRDKDPTAWAWAAHRRRAFLVRIQVGPASPLPPLAGPDNRFALRDERRFPGWLSLAVGRYTGPLRGSLERREGHPVIRWSLGHDIAVSPSAAHGSVDSVSVSDHLLSIEGWATDGARRAGAERVLAFSGRRLLSIGLPGFARPDVAKDYGRGALGSGYALTASVARPNTFPPRLRVFAIARGQASELPLSQAARRASRKDGS